MTRCSSCRQDCGNKEYYFEDNTVLCRNCNESIREEWVQKSKHGLLKRIWIKLRKILFGENKSVPECKPPKATGTLTRLPLSESPTKEADEPEPYSTEEPKIVVPRERPLVCQKCQGDIGGLNRYICKFCGRHHCGKHRTPEQHECTGNPQKPRGFTATIIKG